MRTTPAIFATAAAVALVLAMGAPASAQAPEVREDDDKLVLDNGHVTVWFQGKKPMLKLFPAGNESLAYGYKFTEVVEFRDLDANGVPTEEEIVARLALDKASAWEVERAETNDSVVLNLTTTSPVKLGRPVLDQEVGLPEQDATVSLVFTLRADAATLDVDGANVSVPATHVKYDFVVEEWPFLDADANRLALVSIVEGELAVEGVDLVGAAAVEANGTKLGALTWLASAKGKLANGTEVDVPVNADITTVGNESRLVFAYDAAGLVSLVHDPTVGVMATDALDEAAEGALADLRNTVPGAGLLATGAVLGASALVARRRG